MFAPISVFTVVCRLEKSTLRLLIAVVLLVVWIERTVKLFCSVLIFTVLVATAWTTP